MTIETLRELTALDGRIKSILNDEDDDLDLLGPLLVQREPLLRRLVERKALLSEEEIEEIKTLQESLEACFQTKQGQVHEAIGNLRRHRKVRRKYQKVGLGAPAIASPIKE